MPFPTDFVWGAVRPRPYCIMNKAGIRLDTRFA